MARFDDREAVLKFTKFWPLLGISIACACGPIEVLVFEDRASEEPPPPVILGLGGHRAEEEGDAPITTFLLDDFEDGDTKANDPGGWWYMVNDGTGTQALSVRPSEEISAEPSGSSSFALETQAEGFSDWGAALGVDIAAVIRAENAIEATFSIAASPPAEVVFHAIDGTGAHFTRTFLASTEWSTSKIRLDQLFIVEGDSVRTLDVKSATELQWFIVGENPTTVWLDNVTLRFW